MKYTIISCFLFGLFATAHGLIKAGDFQNYAHGIGGEVMIQDEKTIIIRGFTYDGAGPDAFFWTGTSENLVMSVPFFLGLSRANFMNMKIMLI